MQTELAAPDQAGDPAAMPLDAYISEVMALLKAGSSESEILVERVKTLRSAERSGSYDQVFAALNPD